MRPDGPLNLSDEFNQLVELTCTARVGGETIVAQVRCLRGVYNDPEARKAIEADLRMGLMRQILGKWTPKIHVRS